MKREKYIDISRALAMILVVMVHCVNETSFGFIGKFSGLFFIPLFIFISGSFSKENEIMTFKDLLLYLKKKLLRLYKFYVFWELLYFALTNVFFKIGFYSSSVVYGNKLLTPINSFATVAKKILEIVLLMGREPFCGAFWFLISLMFIIIGMSIINLIVNKYMKNRSKKQKSIIIGSVVFICYIIGCIMSKTYNIPRVSPAFTLMIFYYIGYLANKYKNKIKYNNIIISLVCLAILIFLSNYDIVSLNVNKFPNGLFLMVSSLSGIYFIMFISKQIEKVKYISDLFSYIGKNTLPIIAMHFISFKLVMIIQWKTDFIEYIDLARLTGWNNGNMFYVLYVLAGIFIPLLIDYCSKKTKIFVNEKIRFKTE